MTDDLWQRHLDGEPPALGIIPINENNQCKWGCIDIDIYNLDHKKLIDKIKNKIYRWLYLDRSLVERMYLFL